MGGTRCGPGLGKLRRAKLGTRVGLSDGGCVTGHPDREYDHSPDERLENDDPGVAGPEMTVLVDLPGLPMSGLGHTEMIFTSVYMYRSVRSVHSPII